MSRAWKPRARGATRQGIHRTPSLLKPFMATLAVALAAGSLGATPIRAADDFSVMDFRAFCGDAVVDRVDQAAAQGRKPNFGAELQGVLRATQGDARSHRVYETALTGGGVPNNTGPVEVDEPAGIDCVPRDRMTLVEDYAEEILGEFQAMGFHRHGHLPVVQGAVGQRVNRIYIGQLGAPASTYSPCRSNGSLDPDRVSRIRLNPDYVANQPNYLLYFIIAHEMTHVVQHGSQMVREQGTDDCANIHGWIMEGTANAVARKLVVERFGKQVLQLEVPWADDFYGLRSYNISLSQLDDSVPARAGYAASSFWRHLAEHYFDGDYDFLAALYAQPDSTLDGDDWLTWLTTILDADAAPWDEVDDPLYLIFPHFLADYAAWGDTRYKHLGGDTWRQEAFNNCRRVTLSPSRPQEKHSLSTDPLTGDCFWVVAHDLGGYNAAGIKIMATDDDSEKLDATHLAAVSLQGQDRRRSCYVATRAARGMATCLRKPFFLDVPERGAEEAGGDYAKTWLGTPQTPSAPAATGDQRVIQSLPEWVPESACPCLVNMYVASYAPPDVSDDDVASATRRTERIDLRFGLDATKMQSGGDTSSAPDGGQDGGDTSAAVGGPANVHDPQPTISPPGTITTPPDRHGELGPPGSPGQADSGSEISSRIVGMQREMAKGPGNKKAITAFNFTVVMVGDAPGPRPDELEARLNLRLRLPTKVAFGRNETIDYGQTRTQEAYVMGGGREGGAVMNFPPDAPSGEVSVLKYDATGLHVKARGTFCFMEDMMATQEGPARCRDVQRFSGEMIKPFGWVYDPDFTPSNRDDTPGMRLYRKWLDRQMAGLTGFGSGPRGDGDGSDASGSGSDSDAGGDGKPAKVPGTDQAKPGQCDCSCEAMRQMQSRVRKMAERATQGGGVANDAQAVVDRMKRCTPKCRRKWAACGS